MPTDHEARIARIRERLTRDEIPAVVLLKSDIRYLLDELEHVQGQMRLTEAGLDAALERLKELERGPA